MKILNLNLSSSLAQSTKLFFNLFWWLFRINSPRIIAWSIIISLNRPLTKLSLVIEVISFPTKVFLLKILLESFFIFIGLILMNTLWLKPLILIILLVKRVIQTCSTIFIEFLVAFVLSNQFIQWFHKVVRILHF